MLHERTGKLQDLAVDFFERAYGLNSKTREDHNELCTEAIDRTGCSRRAFRELIYGHSYQSILGTLRELVPGYRPKVSKKEQRDQQMQEIQMMGSGGMAMAGLPHGYMDSLPTDTVQPPITQQPPQPPPPFDFTQPVSPSPAMTQWKQKLAKDAASKSGAPKFDLATAAPSSPPPSAPQESAKSKPPPSQEQKETPPPEALNSPSPASRQADKRTATEAKAKAAAVDASEVEAKAAARSAVPEASIAQEKQVKTPPPSKPKGGLPGNAPMASPRPPAPGHDRPFRPQQHVRVADVVRYSLCTKALCPAVFFFFLRQYMWRLASYSGSMDMADATPLLLGSYGLVLVLLWQALVAYRDNWGLPLKIACCVGEYIETWEFLAVADAKTLNSALTQVKLLVEACIEGVSTHSDVGLNRAVSRLDFLHSVHCNLVSEIGSTVLVMRLVDSLQLLRASVLKVRLACSDFMPVADVLATTVLVADLLCLLLIKHASSLLVEILLIPSMVYVLAYTHLLLKELELPFDAASCAPADLDPLLYLHSRVVHKIEQVQQKRSEAEGN